MEVTLVKFKNLLEENYEDISYGVMLKDGNILCLDSLSIFTDEDYLIIKQTIVGYENIDDFWEDVAYREHEELFAD